jgi:hypothetical protein
MSPNPRSAPRRRWRRGLSITGVISFILGGALLLALTCRPAWYQPAAIDRAQLPADRAALADLIEDIGVALNAGESCTFTLTADQINRWITARDEIWPDTRVALEPLRDPQVALRPGKVILAATAARAGLRGVVSIVLGAEVAGDEIRVRVRGTRLGRCPLPRKPLERLIHSVTRLDVVRAAADEPYTLIVDNRGVWPNGRRRYRVAELDLQEGQVTVRLEPLARR